MGNCDDFAMLMASLIASLGGSTRITFASNMSSTEGHAYCEVFLGSESNSQVDELINWTKSEYNLSEVPGLNTTGDEVWMNLDWWADNPGGPYFKGDERMVVWQSDKLVSPKIVPIIDTMDSIDGWVTSKDSKGSNISISSYPARKGLGIGISYNLKQGGWVDISRNVDPKVLSQVEGLNFSFIATDKQNTIELRLAYANGTEFGYSWRPDLGKWVYLQALFKDFKCYGLRNICSRLNNELDPNNVGKLEIIVSSQPGDEARSGRAVIDHIRGVMNIPAGSPWARVEEQRKRDLAMNLTSEAGRIGGNRGDQLPLRVLLTAEAIQKYPYWGDEQAIYDELAILPYPVACLVHNTSLRDIAYSPDGKHLATVNYYREVNIWDLVSGEKKQLKCNFAKKISFSPDGSKLAAAGWTGTAIVWSVPGFQEIERLNHSEPSEAKHTDNVNALTFSPDGKYLAMGDNDGLKIWESNSSQMIKEFVLDGTVDAIAFSPNGEYLAACGHKNVSLWDVKSWQKVGSLNESYVSSVAFSPDGNYLATAGGSFDVQLWKWNANGNLKKTMAFSHDDNVNAIAFSPDGKYIATAGNDNTARIWDLKTGKEITRMVHDGPVSSVSFSPDGQFIATGSWDNTARIWEIHGWNGLTSVDHKIKGAENFAFSKNGKYFATIAGRHSQVWALTPRLVMIKELQLEGYSASNLDLSSTGRYLALAKRDGKIQVWNVSDQKEILSVDQGGENNSVLLFSPDERYLASANDMGRVSAWNLSTGQMIANTSHDGPVMNLAFSQDSHDLISLSMPPTPTASPTLDNLADYENRSVEVVVFNLTGGREVNRLDEKGSVPLALSDDGKYLASNYFPMQTLMDSGNLTSLSAEDLSNMTIGSWTDVIDIATKNRVMHVSSNSSSSNLKFSPDGKNIASGEFNYVIVSEVQSGKIVAKLGLTGIATGLSSLDFSPDSKYLAASDGNGKTRIWEMDSHQEVATINQGTPLLGLAFSQDGRYLATLTNELKLSLWPRDPKEMISESLDRLTKNMNQEESSRFLGSEQGQKINHNFSSTWINSTLTESIRNNTPVLIASPASASPGENILLKYSGAPGNRGDWTALYPIGETSKNYDTRYYEFLYGNKSGELSFIAPNVDGLYQFRLFADWPNGGYDALAISNSINVSRAG